MTQNEVIDGIALAIGKMEGFKPGTRAWRNNNPGNLRDYKKKNGRWALWSNLEHDELFVKFRTPDDGWAALRRQVKKNIERGLSLFEFFHGKQGVYGGYAPDSDGNNSKAYAMFVSRQVGIDDIMKPIGDYIE